jgi:hypothetical protein
MHNCMWTQHWVVLQFVHPVFAVPHDLNLSSNSGRFKHGNYADFIRVAEGDSNDANQIICWNGSGIWLTRECWVTREATTRRCAGVYMSMAMLAHMQLVMLKS